MTEPRRVTMLALGGPLHDRLIAVDAQRCQVVAADPQETSPRHLATYAIRELAIFGRRVRLLVLSTLTDEQVSDLAWQALGSQVVHDLHATQMEQGN